MKRLLLASVGLVALAAPTFAADLPARRGPAVAPVAVAPIYNWTGFYIGGHAGWGRAELTETFVTTFAGFPVGTSFSEHEDGFLAGGQVGFNYQIGQWVIGVEGQISWTDIGRSVTVTCCVPLVTATARADLDWVATVAARLGVAFGNALLYVKGGVAFADWSASVAFTGGVVGAISTGDTETGWMVGAGIEWGFTPNWSAKIEYNFMDFDLGRSTVVVGGVTGIVDHDLDVHLIKVGINYRFAPVAAAPVTARY